MASMVVDGIQCELRFDADGAHHCEAEGVSQEEKEAAMVVVSNLSHTPSPSMNPVEASFADQVGVHPHPPARTGGHPRPRSSFVGGIGEEERKAACEGGRGPQ